MENKGNLLDRYISNTVHRFGAELVGFFIGIGVSGVLAFLFYQKLYVPQFTFEQIEESQSIDIDDGESALTSDTVVSVTPVKIPTPSITIQSSNAQSDIININSATQSELESLPRIGPVLAKRIIDSRPYSYKGQIQNVTGIGPKTYVGIKDKITVE